MFPEYDVIVVGGGHAGCEAAYAAANLGSATLLITMNMQTIANMSCNPAMGGVAKGQIVREIDALGGYSGIVTDKTMIQFRMLNKSKGPAMWSPRAQSDRLLFAKEWRDELERTDNLDFWQDTVAGLIVEGKTIKGVRTQMGHQIKAKSVILTNGTFLNGLIHIGEQQFGGGRAGERGVTGLTEDLVKQGFESGRMKTGTPPRVDSRSIDYSKTEEQAGDENHNKFSYTDTPSLPTQRSCWITYTNEAVHEVLRTGFESSPMFTGRIKGLGPRYCPSIEDKINRFAERDRHQIFIEPEGWDTAEVYVNGFSTSLPVEVQHKAMQLIPGFENAKMFRPGYAIEYDFFQPTQLKNTLETKLVSNLYFAGQINGTTGYEEAGCQGMWAGINAHQKNRDLDPFILKRSDAYMGVLIDDLVNKGTNEPYRMFTSRAEFRILLRQDNADIRLTEIGHKLGIASDDRLARVIEKVDATEKVLDFFKNYSIDPTEINGVLEKKGTSPLKQKQKLINVITRPQIEMSDILINDKIRTFIEKLNPEVIEQAEVRLKYDGYIQKEKELVDKMNRLEDIRLNPNFDYKDLNSLSSEAREKLTEIKPATIGQASRISGVSPSDVAVLMVSIGR
jgi:tRNA uridine 5-carboxymethylaminomethyl modification enzyme